MNPKKAAVVMDDGFEELEALGPIDLLRRGGVQVDLVSNKDATQATGRNGVTITGLTPFENYDFDAIDCLILPGGSHYSKLEANEQLKDIIKTVNADPNKILAAICASPTILGRMGLLRGKDYVCFLSMDEDFGGQCQDECYVVTDENLITARSAAAAVDFGLAILEELEGEEEKQNIAESIYY